MLQHYDIDDDLATADHDWIEVTLTFGDGRRRWCLFMTPEVFAASWEPVEDTDVRLHLCESHMFVVSTLTADVIDRVLRQLDAAGELESRSLPLGEG